MIAARNDSVRAFTLIELLVVIFALSILAGIFLPQLARQRRPHCYIYCVNNLKQVGLAFRTWALDNGDKYPMQVSITNGGVMEIANTGSVFTIFQVMSNELSTPKILFCPEESDPKRFSASTFQSSVPPGVGNTIPLTNDNQLSYFVGLDAQDTFPQAILCGDRNLAVNGTPMTHGVLSLWTNSAVTWFKPRHDKGGNIGLADGSVQQVLSPSTLFSQTGSATNRLAIP